MYIKNIYIENMGAIKKFELSENELFIGENPKPIIIVGKNGDGKTTLLSCIVDALYQLQSKAEFRDVPTYDRVLTYYYRISGGITQRHNANYAISAIEFKDKKRNVLCTDCIGEIPQDTRDKIKGYSPNFQYKEVLNLGDLEELKKDFKNNTYCFFPAERYEIPYWLNKDLLEKSEDFHGISFKQITSEQLNKPLTLYNSLYENIRWIFDVIDDSSTVVSYEGSNFETNNLKIKDGSLSRIAKNSLKESCLWMELIQRLFKVILNLDHLPNIYSAGRQTRKTWGIFVDQVYMTSLSAGQTSLLAIFGTILRYADSVSNDTYQQENNINESLEKKLDKKMENIEGIVIIDEIDTHLHLELQYKVLPKLISMFPKIQFIITTHSPFFIAGMKRDFPINEQSPEEQYLTLDVNGKKLSINDFDDTSPQTLKEIIDSLVGISNKAIGKIQQSQAECIIVTEGKTDIMILEQAASKLEIKLNTEIMSCEDFFDGEGSAERVKKVLIALSQMGYQKKIIGLFDNDSMGYEKFKSLKEKNFKDNNKAAEILKHKNTEVYALLLPIPKNLEHYDTKSHTSIFRFFTIEHYFSEETIRKYNLFTIQDTLEMKDGREILRFSQNNKTDKLEIIEKFEPKDFENFRILFDKLNCIYPTT